MKQSDVVNSHRVTATEAAFQLPLLYVRERDDERTGGVNKIDFTFSRRADNTPLRVLISDDVPDGSKESLRGSVWLAATTAALLRGDVMEGVRVCVEFSGGNDGGSAGALLCCAIMTALEGLPFPPDFTMTGTILPDGTVGLVGGMALKIRGAAEAGFKRVCIPAHRRFEGQPNGSTADLFTFAESLGVKVIPVRHVEEAFAEAHRRPKPLSASTDEDVLLDLGKDVDKLLIEHFRKCKAEFDEFYDDMPETDEERLKFDADPVNVVSGGLASRAVHAFRYGKLFEAAVIMNEAAMSAAATQALRKRYREGYLKQFPALSKPPGPMTTAYRLELAELDELQAREFKDICLASAKQVASFRGCAAIEGQIDCGLKFHSVQVVRLDLLYGLTPARDDIKTKLPNDRLEQVYASEVAVGHQVEMLRLQRDDRFGWKVALGSTMPRRGFAIDPRRLEHLLVTLSQSLNKTIERDVISCSQTDDDNEDDEAVRMARYLRTDQLFRVLQDKKQIVGFLCNECAATGEDADEGAISRVIFALVDLIANQIAVLLKYGNEADINLHDDGFKNVEFISYQLRNVRARALVGIRKCRERGVPCLGAIMSFYDGEILRDMEGKDKMLAWKAYFEADLAANVLLMAFGGESNVSS